MKKFIFALFLLNATQCYAMERYYCEAMTGLTTPLQEKSSWWHKLMWYHKGVEKTKAVTPISIVIEGNEGYIQMDGDTEKTPVLVFTNTDEKAEMLEIGTVASSIYTIDKVKKQIYQAKNGLVPSHLKSILKITQGYQVILKGNCR